MEAQATAQARRAVSAKAGAKAVQIDPSLPSQDPSYSPSPPPGLTSRGRLQEARPRLGRPSRQDSYITSGWDRPHRAKAKRAPRKASGDSQPHSFLGIVVPALWSTVVHPLSALFIPQGPARKRLGGPGPRALWEMSSGCPMTCSVRVVQDYISRCAQRRARPGSEGCEASLEVVPGVRR